MHCWHRSSFFSLRALNLGNCGFAFVPSFTYHQLIMAKGSDACGWEGKHWLAKIPTAG